MKITVLIATHFRDQLLKRALKSALDQSYKPFEIIVLDDTDRLEVRAIVGNLSTNKDINIRYISRSTFSSTKSYNLGVRKANGDILALLDDDDFWHKDYLKKAITYFQKSNADILITPLLNIDENGKISQGKKATEPFVLNDWLLKNPGLIASNLIVKTECFRNVGYMDENLPASADRDLIIRFMQKGYKYVVLNEHLVYYSTYTSGLTRGNIWKKPYTKILFQKKYFRNIPLRTHFLIVKNLLRGLITESYNLIKST